MAFDVASQEQLPVPVNKPDSGTYGERADLENLRAELPSSPAAPGAGPGPGAGAPPGLPGPVRGEAPGMGGRPPGGTLPPGVPAPLAAPTDRPNEQLGHPAMVAPQLTDAQRRIQTLDRLSQSSDPEVKEWAEMMLRIILG